MFWQPTLAFISELLTLIGMNVQAQKEQSDDVVVNKFYYIFDKYISMNQVRVRVYLATEAFIVMLGPCIQYIIFRYCNMNLSTALL